MQGFKRSRKFGKTPRRGVKRGAFDDEYGSRRRRREGDAEEVELNLAGAEVAFDVPVDALVGRRDVMVEDDALDNRLVQPMEDMSKFQDYGDSNKFSLFRIRGGLPNFKLLDYLDGGSPDRKFLITSYPVFTGGVPPTDPSSFVLPFTSGQANYIDPLGSSCRKIGGMVSPSPKRILYSALNAVSSVVKFTVWEDQVVFPGSTFYGQPRPRFTFMDAAPRPELTFLPDPEHCFALGAYADQVPGGLVPLPICHTNWPYDELYHRTGRSISQSHIRISGVVRCDSYYSRLPFTNSYIGTTIGVESSNWHERVTFVRPVIVVVMFVHKKPNGLRIAFDNVIDALGFDAATPQDPNPYVDAIQQNWTPIIPRFYSEEDSECRVLAYDIINLNDSVPESAVRVEQIYNQATSTVPPIVAGEQDPYYIYGSNCVDYQIIDVPYVEKRFVFDVDLNNLVTQFTADHWDYFASSGAPNYTPTYEGVGMIATNSIHIAAYAYYPGSTAAVGYSTELPTEISPSFRQRAAIGYTSHLTFNDFID